MSAGGRKLVDGRSLSVRAGMQKHRTSPYPWLRFVPPSNLRFFRMSNAGRDCYDLGDNVRHRLNVNSVENIGHVESPSAGMDLTRRC